MPEMNNMKVGNDVYEVADPKSRGVSLTWAQYQALSYEEQHNGTAYYITDRDAIYPVDHELNAQSTNAIDNASVTNRCNALSETIAANGAHNLFFEKDYYDGGLLTKNNDGTYSVASGTVSEWLEVGCRKKLIPNTKYVFSIGDSACSGLDLQVYSITGTDYTLIASTHIDKSIEFTTPSSFDIMYIRVKAEGGFNTSAGIISPMIRLASDPSTEYTPYAMTNRELTEKVISKSVTVTPESGYTLAFNHLRVFNNMLYGDVSLFKQDSDLPTRTWVDVATCDLRPSYNIQTSLFSVAEGLSGGLMYIDVDGNIQVFQSYYDPTGMVTKKGAAGVFSHPL